MGLAVGARLTERYGLDGAAFAADDGIVLRVPMMDEDPPGAELFTFEPDELEEAVISHVSNSALFAARFRETSSRALLLPRQNPTQRTPLWQQRQRASQLLEVAAGYSDFPLIVETMREVLQDVYDLPALKDLTQRLEQRRIRLIETTTSQPSPFAQSLLFGYIAQYLYEGDSPLAERRAAALSVDPRLLNELLGRVELREFLDAAIIEESQNYAQRLSPSRRLRGDAEGVADLLRLLGPLSAEQLARRLRNPEQDDEEVHAAQEHVRTWAHELISAQRAFPVSWHGEERFAAAEDAARLRDGLGLPLPQGIQQVFLEPVDDPLGDLLSRYARSHGPFTPDAAAAALGLPLAAVQQTLDRLAEHGRIVEGLFTPDRTTPVDREYCETDMLGRIRRRSLAALRSAVEPVPTAAYAHFLTEWQSVAPGSRQEGTAGLADVLSQLAGYPAPASAWESFILPARVRDYTPSMLDELLSAGEAVVTGHGELAGHDGWISITPTADADALEQRSRGEQLAEAHHQVMEVLERGGAWFAEAIAGAAELSVTATQNALWELFWTGRAAPDSFAPIRTRLSGGSTAHKRKPSASRTRHTSRRMALRRAADAQQARTGTTGGTPSGGRWSLISQPQADDPAAVASSAHARAEILLDRYGVLTRGSVASEDVPGGFAGVYKVLAAAEAAGQVRRGYFIEKLGAAQFTSSATVDRLRDIGEGMEDGKIGAAIALAAADPANPYGAALEWPALPDIKARPGRKAGAVVVMHRGDLALYMERGGKTMLLYVDPDEAKPVAEALVTALRRAKSPRLAVEKVNGEPVLTHPLAAVLREAGFDSSPSGLRL